MAFNEARFVRQTEAFNAGQITTANNPSTTPVLSNGPAWFTYASADDAIATIAAANYFADVVYMLSVNDRIDVTGSDASNFYLVSAVDRDAGTISLVSYAATGVVGTANIQDDAVTTAKIADGAVTAAKIADLSIANADVSATAAIAFSKLAALSSANVLVGSGANVATSVAVTGDVTISNAGVTAIAADSIVNADVNTAAAIAYSKLATLSSGNILVGSAGNVATSVVMSGDVAIIASGATTIQAGAVDSGMMNANMLRYTTAAVSAAEFNGAYAAPKVLLAAQGANTLIVVERAALVMTYVGANYAAGGVVTLQYDLTANGAGVAATNGQAAADFFAAASTTFMMDGVAGNTVAIAPFTTSANKGIYLSNVTQAFTTGDSTWVVHLWYRVIPTI